MLHGKEKLKGSAFNGTLELLQDPDVEEIDLSCNEINGVPSSALMASNSISFATR